MTFFLADEELSPPICSREPTGAQLVTGGPYKVPGSPPRVFNSAFLLLAGDVLARYDKRVLMPFAEYYPGWLKLFLNRRFDGVSEFTSGDSPLLLPTVAVSAAVVTCSEALFPRAVNERVAGGGGYLVNLANDGWLGVHR